MIEKVVDCCSRGYSVLSTKVRVSARYSFLILSVLVSSGVQANDLIAENVVFTFERNGNPVLLPNQLGYIQGDSITAQFTLSSSVQCVFIDNPSPPPLFICEPVADFQARAILVASPPGCVVPCNPTLQERLALGEVAVSGDTDVQFRPSYAGEFKQFSIDLTALPNFEGFAVTLLAQDYSFEIEVVLDPSNALGAYDSVLTNNTVAQISSDFVPLNSSLAFGPTPSKLVTMGSLTADATCGADSGDSGGLANFRLSSSSAEWLAGAAFGAQTAPLNSFCVAWSRNGDAFDLQARDSVNVGSLNGSFGGLNFIVDNNVLATTGASHGKVTVDLPPDHSIHALDAALPNGPVARGSMRLIMQAGSLADLTDFDQFVVNGGVNQFLHSGGLPFSIRLDSVRLDSNGLLGLWDEVHHLHNRAEQINPSFAMNAFGPISNDWRFGNPTNLVSQSNRRYSVDSRGLDIPNIDFDVSARGRSHFPRTEVTTWPAMAVRVEDGRFSADQVVGKASIYSFDMSTQCEGCASGNATPHYALKPSATEGLADDGAILARVGNVIDPKWGPYVTASSAHIFERLDDVGKAGIFYLPGGVVSGSGGADSARVSHYLMGMRSALDVLGTLMPSSVWSLTHFHSRRGNHFMAGLTLGPDVYSSLANKQPVVKYGVSLDTTRTQIGFGGALAPTFTKVVSNIGTKYIVRKGGLTGAFNTSTPPTPVVYGYTFPLRRFAYTQVNNILGDYTWIDGEVNIPGMGGFDIVFDSLALTCSGDIGSGLVAREDAPGGAFCGDGLDNNNNGAIDENCSEDLDRWHAKIDLLTMEFVPDNPALDQCAAQNRTLKVGNTVDIKALDEPLGMLAKWQPNGDPGAGLTISGKTDQTVDDPDGTGAEVGLNIALDKGGALKPAVSTGPAEGWFALDVEVALPFWDALPLSSRLANSNSTTAAQSIMIKRGGNLTGTVATDDTNSNTDLTNTNAMKNIAVGDPNIIETHYEWGSTGFGFSMPVYYDVGRISSGKQPQFLGHTLNADLHILTAKAGVDYVNPESTKISFGASADFAALESLSFDLNIDLNNPDSVSGLDGFLCGLPGVNISACPGTPVGDLISDLKGKMNLLNIVVDTGFNEFVEEGVRGVVAGLPLNDVVNQLNLVNGLSGQLASAVEDKLNDSLSSIVNSLGAKLDTDMTSLYNDLPQLIINGGNGMPNGPSLKGARKVLEDAELALGEVTKIGQQVEAKVAEVESEVQAIVNQMAGGGGTIQLAIDRVVQLKSLLNSSDLVNCSDLSPVLGQIDAVSTRLTDAVSGLQSVQLVTFAQQVASVAGFDLSAVQTASNAINAVVEELTTQASQAQSTLNTLCTGTIATEITQVVTQAVNLLTNVEAALTSVKTEVSGLVAVINTQMQNTNVSVSALTAQISSIQSFISTVKGCVNEAEQMGFCRTFAQPGISVADIQGLLDQTIQDVSGNAYTWFDGVNSSIVAQLSQQLTNDINQAIANAAAAVAAEIPSLKDVLPYPTAKELENMIVAHIMNQPAIESINKAVHTALHNILGEINTASLMVFDQMNHLLQSIVKQFSETANAALKSATTSISNAIPVSGGTVDGYATITGDDLERLHIGAEWSMKADTDESSSTFNAALDVTSWSANNKGINCGADNPASIVDAVISATSLPFKLGTSGATIKELYLGFTLNNLIPEGMFGGISLDGDIDFQAFTVYDVAFASGVGTQEVYMGASAGALFDDIQMKVAFLAGRTCNTDVLVSLDPQAAEFITPPNGLFNGVYARGSASFPVWSNGCFLTIGVGADAGAWLLVGPPFTTGGLVGGAVFGQGLCIASVRGQMLVHAEKQGLDLSTDGLSFGGEAWVAAGTGFCSPGSWTSRARSRKDDWCGTGDAGMGATYDDGWHVESPSVSAIH